LRVPKKEANVELPEACFAARGDQAEIHPSPQLQDLWQAVRRPLFAQHLLGSVPRHCEAHRRPLRKPETPRQQANASTDRQVPLLREEAHARQEVSAVLLLELQARCMAIWSAEVKR
jgi:hypothetical protein